jgi:4-hydroxy-tetrahydrodipicolinate reductase
MIRVAVTGAIGRMGGMIVKTVAARQDVELVLAVEASKKPEIGKDVHELVGLGKTGITLTGSSELENALRDTKPDVLIDFTSPDAACETVKTAARSGVNLIVGTTGFTRKQKKEIEDSIKKSEISAVISPNMATGVNVFFKAVRDVAKTIGSDYDIEIIEAHHKFKKDAPSGTALRAGELIAGAAGKDIEEVGMFGRSRGVIGKRGEEIGFHSIRAGDIVGDHTVLFAGEGERVEVTHRAHSRQAFVNGAMRAVRWLYENGEPGRIYSSWDVLGIR